MNSNLARAAALVLCLTAGSGAAVVDTIESAGTDLAIAMPMIAGSIAVYKGDWSGVGQLGVDTVATVGTAELLKHFVREQRPDHSDFQSFPSDTVALSASGSSFLWARY